VIFATKRGIQLNGALTTQTIKQRAKAVREKQKEVKERAKVKVKAEKANLAKAEEAKATFQLITSQTMHTWQRKIGNQPKKIGNQLMKIGN
jgi:hypothetical protein